MAEPLAINFWSLSSDSHIARALIEKCSDRLPQTELARCNRLQNRTDRETALLSRLMVRTILALFHGVDPATINIARSIGGKPVVESATTSPHFSLSHSNRQVLLGVSTKPIGVDIEQQDQKKNTRALARRFFSKAEWNHLEQLPEKEARVRFYDLWVLKEACCKAIALPLAMGLKQFHFKVDSERGFQLLQKKNISPKDWQYRQLKINADCSSAVACYRHSGLITIKDHTFLLTDALSLWACR